MTTHDKKETKKTNNSNYVVDDIRATTQKSINE